MDTAIIAKIIGDRTKKKERKPEKE